MLQDITKSAKAVVDELIEAAKLKEGQILVIGCSSSEIGGHSIGSYSSLDVAQSVIQGVLPVLEEHGIYLAAQCCEHLNRAIIVEKELAVKKGLTIVNAVPQAKARNNFV